MNLATAGCAIEELAHTSEIGLRAHAPALAGLFGCLARAMVALTGVQADNAAEPMTLEVDVRAVDVESLLVDWLNEVLFLHEATGIVPQDVTIQALTPEAIQATLHGRAAREPGELQIKAVTYHQLQVAQTADEWIAEVFFDI